MRAFKCALANRGPGGSCVATATFDMGTSCGDSRDNIRDRRFCRRRNQDETAVIPGVHRGNVNPGATSMLMARFLERGLLVGSGLLLVLGPPFLVGHAVNERAALVLGHWDMTRIGRVLHPVRQAVAAEPGK